MDHKDHRSIGTLVAVDQVGARDDLMGAFIAAEFPTPKEAQDADALRAILADTSLDLIVMSSHLGSAYVAPLISEVRRGKLGPHPFPIVVVLTDDDSKDNLRQISNCGPDDIVLLPSAPEDLLARVNVFLAGGRRPLVVNAGYAGPERRNKDRE